jgi:N-acetyltransferase
MDPGRLVLNGVHLTLRPLDLADTDSLAVAAAESRTSYLFTPVPEGPAQAKAYIEQALRQRDAGLRYPFAILWHGRLVGTTSYWDYQPWEWPAGCGLQRRDSPDTVEVGGTWLSASAQRTACNTEAKFLMLEYAFETWSVHRVFLRTDERNEQSRRAIERLGAKFEGIRRADMPGEDCTVRNSAYYSIISAEWPEVRLHLITLRGVE